MFSPCIFHHGPRTQINTGFADRSWIGLPSHRWMGNHGWLRLIEAWWLPLMLVPHLVLPWVCENSRAVFGTLIPASSEDSSTAQVVLLGLLQRSSRWDSVSYWSIGRTRPTCHPETWRKKPPISRRRSAPDSADSAQLNSFADGRVALCICYDRNMLNPLKLPKDPKKIGGLASHIFQENLATLAHRQNNFDCEVGLDPNNYCRS